MKNEGDVKAAVKKVLKLVDSAWYYMPVQTGYGVKGIPDFVGCVSGRMFAIETKFGANDLSKWQDIQVARMREAGAVVWVVNEKTIDSFAEAFLLWATPCE